MNIIDECFTEYSHTLAESLQLAGFSTNQAARFLPFAALCIETFSQRTSVFQALANLVSGRHNEILKTFNLDLVKYQSGIDSVQLHSGLKAITPVLLQACSTKSSNTEHSDTDAACHNS